MKRRDFTGLCLLTCLPLLPAGPSVAGGDGRDGLTVPYVPTDPAVVKKMLEMAAMKSGEKIYDLGCGDGRIVIAAAKSYGAYGVGIDLNPQRITEARANAKAAGVENKVEFRQQDLMQADFSDANVVSLYLLPSVNLQLRPNLWKQLRPGTRVVSHDFDMGREWPPEQKIEMDGATIYRWTITEAQKNKTISIRPATARQPVTGLQTR